MPHRREGTSLLSNSWREECLCKSGETIRRFSYFCDFPPVLPVDSIGMYLAAVLSRTERGGSLWAQPYAYPETDFLSP